MSDRAPTDLEVHLFGTPTCPHCHAARAWLAEHRVAFTDLDVTADPMALRRMIWATGQVRVPVVLVGRRALVGFDPAALEALIAAPDAFAAWNVPRSVIELAKASEIDSAQASSPLPGHEQPAGEGEPQELEDRELDRSRRGDG